jgi:hypothetical protein
MDDDAESESVAEGHMYGSTSRQPVSGFDDDPMNFALVHPVNEVVVSSLSMY